MERELSAQEIIVTGEDYETYDAWERAQTFARAVYGPRAARLTYSQTAFPEHDHHVRTLQALAFDSAGKLLPYHFATAWWASLGVDEPVGGRYKRMRSDLASGLGASLKEPARVALRAFAEETLGVETLRTWADTSGGETLTWMFDFFATPPLPTGQIIDDAGRKLVPADVIVAGKERAAYQRWQGAHEYVMSLYGERAARAEVIAFSRYNDSTYDRDMRLEVYDANETRIAFDLRGAWWLRFAPTEDEIARYAASHVEQKQWGGEYDPAFDDAPEAANAEIARMREELLGFENLESSTMWDADVQIYDLATPPTLCYPRLWLREA
jgi:hypothetical protein